VPAAVTAESSGTVRRAAKAQKRRHVDRIAKATDLDTWARNEIKRGMAVKTINNRLAVLSTLIKY
jgi:hypothetical protein